MIESELKAKDGAPIQAVEHPDYLDYPVRDSRTRTSWAKVAIHVENRAAPIVAALNGKTTIETYTLLTNAINELRAKHPNRFDAIRVLEWHRDTGRPHPNARWHVTGAEGVPKNVRWIERATQPRYSFTSKTADPLTHDIRWLGEAERMDEMELDSDLDRLLGIDLGRWDEISGAALLQKESPVKTTGGGGSKGAKKKKGGSSAGMVIASILGSTPPGYEYDEAKIVTKVVRMPVEVHEALKTDPKSKVVFAAVARALNAGMSYKSVIDRIEDGHPGGTMK